MRPRVRIAEPEGFSTSALRRLREVADVSLEPCPPEDLTQVLRDVDVFWFRLGHQIDGSVISKDTRCRIIATPVTGLDHIDLDACAERGIRVISLRGESQFLREVRATAELTLGLAIALMRHIPRAAADVMNGNWCRDKWRGHELHGKTVGIVGVGRLGSIVARYYGVFGMRILGYDPRPDFPTGVVPVASLPELFERCDLVSIHAAYNETTHHLIDRAVLSRARPHMVLVNTARGNIVDEAALLNSLKAEQISGAALDVVAGEPQLASDNPLVAYAREHDNLLIVPHIGGNTFESFEKTECFLAERVTQALGEMGFDRERCVSQAGTGEDAVLMSEAPEKYTVLGVIPARGGSKGIPKKNIKPLLGRPLLAYTVDAARKSRRLTHVVVSTDDSETADIARELGVEVIDRPQDLARDTTPTLPVVQHALDVLEPQRGRFDYVFTLQVTSPFRSAADIDQAIELLQTSGAESVIGVVRVFDNHPARVKKIREGRLEAFETFEPEGIRRQDLPPAYLRNGAVYVVRRDVLDRGSLLGQDQCPFEMPPARSINIDEPLDFALAEAALAGGFVDAP
jgi:D-3-phosphoglycerate dehydrogenase